MKRTNQKLWERIVGQVKAGSKGGKSGQWSARKALSPGQKAAGSRAKNKATKAGKQSASYTAAERRAVKRATKK